MKDTFVLAIKTFGPEHQKKKVIEELAELQVEIARSLNGANNTLEILDEIADVYNMLEQLVMIHSFEKEIDFKRQLKAEKLQRIIENYEKVV